MENNKKNLKNLNKPPKGESKTQFYEQLAKEVTEDFNRRREERRTLEQQWKLNLNYLVGNQYAEITPTGEVDEQPKDYFWQNRAVFNHIAPIFDTRLAKLSRVRPVMSVRASGDQDNDIKSAKMASALLNSTFSRLEMSDVIYKATLWSETMGTSFYKVLWDSKSGKQIGSIDGETVYEGDVKVIALSPFDIYPDSLFCEDIDEKVLAKSYGISYSHFSRSFKRVTGITFKNYLNRTRISKAEQLLFQNECSVSEVASACGYNSTAYFIKVYRSIKGKTPYKALRAERSTDPSR